MKNHIVAAVVCAMATALAGHASAEIMEFAASGNWNSSHTLSGWGVDMVFDTNQAVESAWTDRDGYAGHMLTVSQTLSGSESVGSPPVPITSFVLYQSSHALLAAIPGGVVGIDGASMFSGILPFDEPISTAFLGSAGSFWHGPGTVFEQEFTYHTSLIDLGPSPVPEPATWALFIGGLVAVGTMLRRRKWAGLRP